MTLLLTAHGDINVLAWDSAPEPNSKKLKLHTIVFRRLFGLFLDLENEFAEAHN